MKKRLFNILISIICVFLVWGSVITAYAEPDFEGGNFDETTTSQTTTESDDVFVPDDNPLTTDSTQGAQKPVIKPNPTTTKVNTTQRVNEENQRPVSTTRRQNTTTTAFSGETELPEGSFYVYVEKNNGEPRLKRVMQEPGIVPEPNEPVRTGYVFQGWYADAKFTKPWNFFVDFADSETVIYAKWEADPNTIVYTIGVNQVEGGKIEVYPSQASAEESVVISVIPDEGKRLVAGSLKINGVATDVLSFVMPAKNVIIEAEFEDVPFTEIEKDEKSLIPFIIGGIVLLIAIVVIIILVSVRRRNSELDDANIDENGTIIDDDLDDSWYDETIQVEDGFKDGEKVKGNYIPEEDIDFFDIEE